jgi:hypothetical protein
MRASKAVTRKFCGCIKAVRKTVKLRSGKGSAGKESAAIAICTKSVLQTKGKTLRKVACDKGRLNVQPKH